MRTIGIIPISEFYQRVDNARLYIVYVGDHVVQVSLSRTNSAKDGWVATFPRFFLDGNNYVALAITRLQHDGYNENWPGGKLPFAVLLESDELGLRSK